VVGNPQRHFRSLHVGGTNGKGSTAAFLESMLRAAGHRVGLYTSPHLVSFTERMQVDGVPAAETAVTAWTSRLEEAAVATRASFFEITTAIALADFAARGVEIAVVEVGLGGRLDATNVIDPLVAGVTRIALEHTEYLGADLAGIAREKAGIAKAGVSFMTTEPDPALVGAMAEVAESSKVRVERVPADLAAGYPLGLKGPHQLANASLALAMVRALPAPWRPDGEAERTGLAAARVPGRFDRRGPWLFDVAHNPDGVRALVAALREEELPRPMVAVVAVLKDKAWADMLDLLAPVVDGMILTRAPSAPADREWELEEVVGRKAEVGAEVVLAVEPDFARALARAKAAGRTILVTGSFHTVGDAMKSLGIDP